MTRIWKLIVSAVGPLATSFRAGAEATGRSGGVPEAGSGVAGRPALSPDTKRLLLAVGIAHTHGNGGRFS